MNNYTKPIMPPNMKWYKFFRAIAPIIGVALIMFAILSLIAIAYINLGNEIEYVFDVGTNPITITIFALADVACGIVLLWLHVNMPYLTKKVYTVLTCYMWILFSLYGWMSLFQLIAFSIVEDETLLSDSIVYLIYLIYPILNLVYLKKRKKYFIYETKVRKNKDNVSNNAQAYIVHFSCLCSNCGKNIKAKYRLKQNSSSTSKVSVNCPQCQARTTVQIRLPFDYTYNVEKTTK